MNQQQQGASMSGSKFERTVSNLKERVEQRIQEFSNAMLKDLDTLATVPGPTDGQDAIMTQFMGAFKKFVNSYTQVDLLTHLLNSAQACAPRVVLLILKEKHMFGWSARGFSESFQEDEVKKVRWPVEQFPELVRSIVKKDGFVTNFSDLSDIAGEIKAFDGFIPLRACFFPIQVRNKVSALLYADSGSESSLAYPDMLQILAYLAGLELTMITLKLKKPSDASREEQVKAPAPPSPEPGPKPAAPGPEPKSKFEPIPEPEPAAAKPAAKTSGDDERARRTARVLVSDIKLYHEQVVAQGQQEGNLYELLKNDIDRSYQHFKERAGESLGSGKNYFKEELIKQLADGKPELLGPLPF